jgi:hypothetical protein
LTVGISLEIKINCKKDLDAFVPVIDAANFLKNKAILVTVDHQSGCGTPEVFFSLF